MAARTRKNHSRKARKDRKTRKGRKGTAWTDAVKRVHTELKRKNPNASLGDAMKEASKRKNAGRL